MGKALLQRVNSLIGTLLLSSNHRDTRLVLISCLVVACSAFTITTGMRSVYNAWVVRRLVKELSSSKEDIREQAIESLHVRDVDTSRHLLKLLWNPNAEVRSFAAGELNQQLPIPPSVIEAFLGIVADENEAERVRWWAIFTFQKLGEQAHGPPTDTEAAIIGALCRAVESSNSDISASAASALEAFGPRAEKALPYLSSAISRDSGIVRVHAAGALMAIDRERRQSVLPILLEAAQSKDDAACSSALYYLGKLGSDARCAVPILKQIVVQNPDLEYHVNEVLRSIGDTSENDTRIPPTDISPSGRTPDTVDE
ncbi:MAG: HEAT repeat domain-containing protein [Planctomycetaceae bacterium]|nr:HEAT repeat domain-containing protein [Planctomycetaceae bacterium]